jgi:hypothetical protein
MHPETEAEIDADFLVVDVRHNPGHNMPFVGNAASARFPDPVIGFICVDPVVGFIFAGPVVRAITCAHCASPNEMLLRNSSSAAAASSCSSWRSR